MHLADVMTFRALELRWFLLFISEAASSSRVSKAATYLTIGFPESVRLNLSLVIPSKGDGDEIWNEARRVSGESA
ncbi:hypothetical protein BV20DRAFT_98911 [Pilatotrama ljubarskyi]|nr:hypothetical protein BV20DRAFT_98911 [Pilatotrama ljubarskyi]